jgi:hypothetical protein
MFRQALLQFAATALQAALKSPALTDFLKNLLGGLTDQPQQVQQLTVPQQPPEVSVEGNTLKIKHANGNVHDVDLSVL